MTFEEATQTCHVRSAIYRSGDPEKKRHWKNTHNPFGEISEADKQETDWEEYDHRDDDEGSLFMFND